MKDWAHGQLSTPEFQGVGRLNAFAVDTPGSPAAKRVREVWTEPTTADFPTEAYVLAVDQSLGALGLVALTAHESVLEVHKAITRAGGAPDGATGWEKYLSESEALRVRMRDELRAFGGARTFGLPWILYHEAPPMGGGKIARPESSLLASAALRAAAADAGVAQGPMIRAQDWKQITLNVPGADKPLIKRLLMPFAKRLGVRGLELVTNESQRDALGVGLASLIRSAR